MNNVGLASPNITQRYTTQLNIIIIMITMDYAQWLNYCKIDFLIIIYQQKYLDLFICYVNLYSASRIIRPPSALRLLFKCHLEQILSIYVKQCTDEQQSQLQLRAHTPSGIHPKVKDERLIHVQSFGENCVDCVKRCKRFTSSTNDSVAVSHSYSESTACCTLDYQELRFYFLTTVVLDTGTSFKFNKI